MGSTNAAVLPLPVFAIPNTSRPERAAGRAWDCTAVGFSYPACSTIGRLVGSVPQSLSHSPCAVQAGSGRGTACTCTAGLVENLQPDALQAVMASQGRAGKKKDLGSATRLNLWRIVRFHAVLCYLEKDECQ